MDTWFPISTRKADEKAADAKKLSRASCALKQTIQFKALLLLRRANLTLTTDTVNVRYNPSGGLTGGLV